MNKLTRIPLAAIAIALLNVSSTVSASTPEGWTSDHEMAEAAALKADQPVLLMFTGSDWCGWCVKLHNEILDTPVFMQWARENIVLVYVDFPRDDYRSEKLKLQNEKLDEKYAVNGYPTLILTDPRGRELGRFGYMQGGPKTFIRAIKKAVKAG